MKEAIIYQGAKEGEPGDAAAGTPKSRRFRARPSNREYVELRLLILKEGLLDKAPAYYCYKILLTLGLFIVGLWALAQGGALWLQLLNAAYLACIFTQVSFFVHDAGHHQICHTRRGNDYLGIFVANFLLGMSYRWWCDNHNRHHVHPNQVELDPDTNIPVLAFSTEQARGMKGLPRLIAKYQAHLFFPLTLLEAVSKRRGVILYLLRRRFPHRRVEIFLTCLHYVWYLSLVFYSLAPWEAVAFIVVHQSIYGVIMATVFAHNHIGMPLMPEDTGLDFLRREVVTSRNVKSRRLTSFWWGGVDYHIEHHLFTVMPRCRLRHAHRLVKAFCEERNIPYHQVGALQSYSEMLQFLHKASAPLRGAASSQDDELYYQAGR